MLYATHKSVAPRTQCRQRKQKKRSVYFQYFLKIKTKFVFLYFYERFQCLGWDLALLFSPLIAQQLWRVVVRRSDVYKTQSFAQVSNWWKRVQASRSEKCTKSVFPTKMSSQNRDCCRTRDAPTAFFAARFHTPSSCGGGRCRNSAPDRSKCDNIVVTAVESRARHTRTWLRYTYRFSPRWDGFFFFLLVSFVPIPNPVSRTIQFAGPRVTLCSAKPYNSRVLLLLFLLLLCCA